MTILAKIVEDYRAAAAKFDEGRKVGKSEVVSKYLELMSRSLPETAPTLRRPAARRSPLLVDKSIHIRGRTS